MNFNKLYTMNIWTQHVNHILLYYLAKDMTYDICMSHLFKHVSEKFPNAIVKRYSDDIKKQLQNGDTLIYIGCARPYPDVQCLPHIYKIRYWTEPYLIKTKQYDEIWYYSKLLASQDTHSVFQHILVNDEHTIEYQCFCKEQSKLVFLGDLKQRPRDVQNTLKKFLISCTHTNYSMENYIMIS